MERELNPPDYYEDCYCKDCGAWLRPNGCCIDCTEEMEADEDRSED